MLQVKIAGCLLSIVIVAALGFGALWAIDSAIGHVTDYKIAQTVTNGNVEIARIQAQDHITVACMEHSWFTSMKSCIDYGGVNGVGGFSWWTIGLMALASVVGAWWWTSGGEE